MKQDQLPSGVAGFVLDPVQEKCPNCMLAVELTDGEWESTKKRTLEKKWTSRQKWRAARGCW